MRSIRRRAGCSTVAKKSGSETATRSTGICRRANQTRTRRRNRLFHQDALEQQRDDLDRRALDRRRRRLLERLLALLQLLEQGGVPTGAARPPAPPPLGARQASRDALLGLADRRAQRGEGGAGARDVSTKSGICAADEPVQAVEHGLGLLGAARQAARARHHPRLVADVARRARAARRGVAGSPSRRSPRPVGVPKPPTRRQTRSVPRVRAPDERPQVDLGQHVALEQQAVRLVIRLFGEAARTLRAARTGAAARRRGRAARSARRW